MCNAHLGPVRTEKKKATVNEQRRQHLITAMIELDHVFATSFAVALYMTDHDTTIIDMPHRA